MPHYRRRHLEALLKKTLNFSPIVGLFGHRQVGKTTLVSRIAHTYQTLDERTALDLANEDPQGFISRSKSPPFAIDECQLAPPLFPALKEYVRTSTKPGQFLITGSVRFSSRKTIRESLTGRIISWELLPMDLSEINETTLPDSILRLLKSKTVETELKNKFHFSTRQMESYLENGGLPGVFAIRSPAIRAQRYETQINTLLERDLRLLLQTTLNYRSLRALLVALALIQGEPIELSSLSRQTRISIPTLKKLLAAFEAMFLIRVIPTEGTEKKPVLFLEDQGEATFLASGRYNELTNLLRLFYSNLRVQIHYRPEEKVRIFQYRNRGGAFIPLCFATAHSALGILPILQESPQAEHLITAKSFLKRYLNAKILFIHLGNSDRILTRKIRSIGFGALL